MAKQTQKRATNALEDGFLEAEAVRAEARRAEKSDGKRSELSSEKPGSLPANLEVKPDPQPAPTTGRRSRRGRTASSIAGSTDGFGRGQDLPDTPSDKLPPRKDDAK